MTFPQAFLKHDVCGRQRRVESGPFLPGAGYHLQVDMNEPRDTRRNPSTLTRERAWVRSKLPVNGCRSGIPHGCKRAA